MSLQLSGGFGLVANNNVLANIITANTYVSSPLITTTKVLSNTINAYSVTAVNFYTTGPTFAVPAITANVVVSNTITFSNTSSYSNIQGYFSMSIANNKLYFYYGNTAIASLDSNGTFVAANTVAAVGTP